MVEMFQAEEDAASPIRRHRENSVGGALEEQEGAERIEIGEGGLRELYAAVAGSLEDDSGSGERVCAEALARYNDSFQFQVHGTAARSMDGSVPLREWLTTPAAEASKRYIDAMESQALGRFFSRLLEDAAGGAGVGELAPILSATEYRQGDYLTVHNDLLQHAAGGRRLAVVAQMSSAEWDARCGGALVWCDPFDTIPPAYNALTIFATDHWSWHFVEPVWSSAGDAECPLEGQHRFAWSGWYEYQTLSRSGKKLSAREAAKANAKAAARRKNAELLWLKGRLDARRRAVGDGAHRSTGALHIDAA